MKILHIRDSLHGGGAERVVVELSRGMASKSNDVTIYITQDLIGYDVEESVKLKVSTVPDFFIRFEAFLKSIIGSFAYFFTSWVHVYYLKKSLDVSAFDKIFIHSISSLLPFSTLRGKHVNAVYHCAKSKLLLDHRSRLSNIKNKFMLKWSSLGKNNIAVSKGVADDLRDNFEIHVLKVIYNPFDFQHITSMSESNLGLTKFGRFVLAVGRLDYQKNHDEILDAFSEVETLYDSLVILGEGTLRDDLELKAEKLGIRDKVYFLGFVQNPYAYMKQAEVFVLTSKFEGFGNVIVEALIVGCPVISSNCPYGPSEILIGELESYLYEPGQVSQLVELLKMIDKNNYPKDLKFMNNFTIDNSCNNYLC